jgi:hypothetical protein
MFAWSQTRLLFTLAVAVLIVMEPVSWMTAAIPGCIVNPESYGAYYPNHNQCPTFHVFLIVGVARVLEHFGDPNWVIADFTVILALSTICLWVVTWRASVRQSRDMEASIAVALKAANAADLSARAAIGVESPIIRFDAPDLYKLAGPFPETGPLGGPDQTGVPSRYSGVGWVIMRNGGRTAAFPSRFDIGWNVSATLHENPSYDHVYLFQRGTIIREDHVKSDPYCRFEIRLTIELSDEQIATIAKQTAHLWLYCRLHYTNFLEDRYEARACWAWTKPRGDGKYYWSGDGYPPSAYEGQRRVG